MTDKNNHTAGKRLYIATYGWPMGAVLYDYRAVFERDLVAESLILPRNSIEGYMNR